MADKKVVLITGCSSGIGKALAFEFQKHNCRVFASARSVDKLGDLRAAGIDLVQLDITDADSMEVLILILHYNIPNLMRVATVLAQAGRIDVLVNNAGLTSYTPGIEVPDKEIRQIFVISSIMGEIATPFSSTYSASKAALTRFSDALRMELAPFNVNVVTVKPGGVKSDIANNAKERTDAAISGDSVYKLIASYIQQRSQASQAHPMPTEAFAEQVVAQVLASKPPASMILATKGRLLWIMSKFMPYWLSDWIFSSKFGLSKLAKLLAAQKKNK